MMKRLVSCALACTLFVATGGPVLAENEFPDRVVRFVVGFPPGGTTDVLARLIADNMASKLDQPVVVENKGGASGMIGTNYVAKSNPDGYTVLFSSSTLATYQSLYDNVPFDPVDDLEPVALVGTTPYVFVVNPSLPVHSISELIDYVKDNPDEINYAASVPGGGPHLAGELFKQQTGAQMLFIPYTGSGASMGDLLSGRLQVGIDNIAILTPHIRSGTLRGIAVTALERTSLLPELPPVSADIPDFLVAGWFGIFAPAGTPPEVIQVLSEAATAVLEQDSLRERMAALGAVPESGKASDLETLLSGEIKMWSAVIRDAGITAN